MTVPLPYQKPPSLWQREPVRVVNAVGTFAAACNAVLLGAGVYDGGAAAAVTGILAAAVALANELFTRNEVVPLKPLERLAATTEREIAEAAAEPPPP